MWFLYVFKRVPFGTLVHGTRVYSSIAIVFSNIIHPYKHHREARDYIQ